MTQQQQQRQQQCNGKIMMVYEEYNGHDEYYERNIPKLQEMAVSAASTAAQLEEGSANSRGGGAPTAGRRARNNNSVSSSRHHRRGVGEFWREEGRLRLLARRCLAEFVGTGMMVQFGTGAVMSETYTGALVGLFQVAAVWIIGVTLAIAATASISGAHLNPAVSIAFALLRPSKSFGWMEVVPYVVSQTLGAAAASWMNYMMYAGAIRAFEGSKGIVRSSAALSAIGSAKAFGDYYLEPVTTPQAFWAEASGTAVLAGVIFALMHPGNDTMKRSNNAYIPPLIGMCVGGLVSAIAPLTQAGLNPARDFGPRIVAYAAGWRGVAFYQSWLYIAAPMVGAPIGAFIVDRILYKYNVGGEEEEEDSKTAYPMSHDAATAATSGTDAAAATSGTAAAATAAALSLDAAY